MKGSILLVAVFCAFFLVSNANAVAVASAGQCEADLADCLDDLSDSVDAINNLCDSVIPDFLQGFFCNPDNIEDYVEDETAKCISRYQRCLNPIDVDELRRRALFPYTGG